MRKILLTGGSGFIGRNILESYLSQKYQIIAPIRSELDLSDEESVKNFFLKKDNIFDVVIHSASKPGHRNAVDTSSLFFSNCRMFYNLIKYSDSFERLINIGSGAIYDMRNYQPKMKESFFGKFIPNDEHGFCKYVLGKEIERSNNIIDLRVFGIFGKYEDYAIRFISNVICKTIFDLPITIKKNRKFDYIDIDDLIPIMDFFIEKSCKYKAYNVTPNFAMELLEIANTVNTISQKNLPIIVASKGLGIEYSGDNSRLKVEMKDFKFSDIENSISKLYDWYNLNQSFIDKNKLLTDK